MSRYNLEARYHKFLEKSKQKHGNKYDYRNVQFINADTPVEIICPTHGPFMQAPKSHIIGKQCIQCAREARKTTVAAFIKKANAIHDNKYSYNVDGLEFVRNVDAITVYCPVHGHFEQNIGKHLQGSGCRQCFLSNRTLSEEDFVERAKATHGGLYDYSRVEYINIHTKVEVICKNHGPFMVSPALHIQRTGCPTCRNSIGENRVREWLNDNEYRYVE